MEETEKLLREYQKELYGEEAAKFLLSNPFTKPLQKSFMLFKKVKIYELSASRRHRRSN
jgi:hypothetical protein